MELSDFHHNKMLILNWLPEYGLRLSTSTSEKLNPSYLGDNLVTKFPYGSRRQAADKPLLKINILTEICLLTNQRRSIKQT